MNLRFNSISFFGLFLFARTWQICFPFFSYGQVITSDVDRFWKMYDQLSTCKTYSDSIFFDSLYLNPGTTDLKKFVKDFGITPGHYLGQINTHLKFWKGVRPFTLISDKMKKEIEALLDTFSLVLPGFKKPKVSLLIGCINS